jgi:hypothetical protein
MAPIDKKLFAASVNHVRREFKKLGFARKKLMNTKIVRTHIPSIRKRGYFTSEGVIYIPVLQQKKGIKDVLRHEYAHALLFHYPKIKGIERFALFGHTKNQDDYISHYAMTNPEEDFCETFMAYIKHKGKLPYKRASSRLKHKWSFITSLRSRSS